MNKKIVKEQDGYWFYDENNDDYEGPFEDYGEAEIAYNANTKWAAKESRHSIKRMRVWDEQ